MDGLERNCDSTFIVPVKAARYYIALTSARTCVIKAYAYSNETISFDYITVRAFRNSPATLPTDGASRFSRIRSRDINPVESCSKAGLLYMDSDAARIGGSNLTILCGDITAGSRGSRCIARN